MTKAVLEKIISETGTGYRGLFIIIDDKDANYKKQIHLYGDFPLLPNGAIINLDYEWNEEKQKGIVKNYVVPLTTHNLALFEKIADFNVDLFKAKLAFHKAMGIQWRKLDKSFVNPYAYYSFPIADRIFVKTTRPEDSDVRLKAIVKELIGISRKNRKDRMTLEEYLKYFDKVEKAGSFPSLPYSVKVDMINCDSLSWEGNEIIDVEVREAQKYIEKDMRFRQKIKDTLLTDDEIMDVDTDGLDEEQIEALKSLKVTTPSVITGGAGAGKTTVIMTVLHCFNQARPGSQVLLLAPTGRASRRLADVTDYNASTIHKALRLIPKDDGCAEFTMYSEHNKLPHDLVIVDESSMIDTMLMAQLLKAVKDEAKLIFVGDHQQLYPVGVGEPFFDFMNSDYCDVYRLLHNHRQNKNDIEKNANLANAEKPFEAGVGVKIADVPLSYIPTLLHKIENANGELASPSQVQIMSPYNRFNRKINDILKKKNENGKRFSVNDKVIAVRNTEDYCNGDVGFVTDVPERGIQIQFEDGRRVYVEQANMDDIQLAYSITVHKMQGSECKRVYLFLPKKDKGIIGKRLLYTAVTRAKDELFIYYYDEDEARLEVVGNNRKQA